MNKFAAKTGLFLLACTMNSPLSARDATTVLLERLDRGGCEPASLADTSWLISSVPVGTHGELNWGDRLQFESLGRPSGYNQESGFTVQKNGIEWRSTDGWTGACVRDGDNSVFVVTGTIELDGCLHELAIGRLDHNDALNNRIEVIFEHAEDKTFCSTGHGGDALMHPGHAHGDYD